jgi:hypothetical protein
MTMPFLPFKDFWMPSKSRGIPYYDAYLLPWFLGHVPAPTLSLVTQISTLPLKKVIIKCWRSEHVYLSKCPLPKAADGDMERAPTSDSYDKHG